MSLAKLPRKRLLAMRAAGNEVLDCYGALARGNTNLLLDLLRGMGPFEAIKAYPPESIVDRESSACFYYHSHREDEHGHFHTMMLVDGDPPADLAPPVAAYVHLIAIKVDDTGVARGLFAPNRWVTGERIRPAAEVVALLDRFVVDHAWPSWLVNRWATAMLRLFRPQIEKLLVARDAALAKRAKQMPGADPRQDRTLEIAAEIEISIDRQIAAV